jgi:tetratricopeptide (TPR) repeat protein
MVNMIFIVRDWLSNKENGPWLIALDNADDIDLFFGCASLASSIKGIESRQIVDLLPRSPNGSILITTRDKRVGQRLTDRSETIMVEPLAPVDAEQLLRWKVGPPDGSSTKNVQSLLEILGFIPLAITQAAAFIQENSMAITSYIEDLTKSDSDLEDYLDEDLPDPRRDPSSENSVIRTWKLSIDQVVKQRPRAAELLSLMAVLDRQAIPKTILHQDSDRSVEVNKAIGTLQAFSLIATEKGGSSFELHRLVQLSIQKWLRFQGREHEWREKALKLMAQKFPSVRYETWQACEMLLPHAKAVVGYKYSTDTVLLQWADLVENLARYEESQGQYNVACRRYEGVLQTREDILGQRHPDTLASMNNLALLLRRLGRYDEAETMHRQALQIQEEVLGQKDPETLMSMNNLAIALRIQGRYDEAETMHRQALQIQEEVLGQRHPETLISMNTLAIALRIQGRYDEAETMHRQALQIQEEVLGQKHPDTLMSMNNLAIALRNQGRHDEAETMHRQVLQIQEEVLGQKHPGTLISMNNLAIALRIQGRHDEAETMHRQVLQIKEEVLGQKHPDTLMSMNNLAVALRIQGRYDEAETMHRQALQIQEEVLGQRHPDTLISMNNLAVALRDQGRYDEAETMHR